MSDRVLNSSSSANSFSESKGLKGRSFSNPRPSIGPAAASRRAKLALVFVLLLAGILRLGWPGLTEFKADEARLTQLALEMAEGQQFPLRGISSSVGFANFPMSVWLYALPLFLWKHVYAATLFTGLLNTLAVLGCFWLVRRYWGTEAALVAALMFAVSPWAIHHSRKIWAQNLLPFFVMGWGISGALANIEGRAKYIVWHWLCLAVAVQAHLAGVALIPATVVLSLIFRKRLNWRLTGLGILLAAISGIPFVYYLASTGKSLGSLLAGSASLGRQLDGAALRYAWLLSSGREIHALAGPTAFSDYLESVPDLTLVHWAWGSLILAGLAGLAWQSFRYRSQGKPAAEAGILLLVWLSAPLLLFTWPRVPVVLHYLLPIYPVPYMACGIAFNQLTRRWPAAGRAVAWIGLSITLLAQVWVWRGLLAFAAVRATPGGVGVPLALELAVATQVEEMVANTGSAEVVIAGAGENTATDEFPAVYSVLLRRLPHRFVDVSRSALFPTAPSVILLDPEAGPGGGIYQSVASRTVPVTLRQGEGSLLVLALPAAAAPQPEFVFDPPQILTNWAAYWGYDWPVPGADGRATWQVYWYTGAASPGDYHMFNHLLDARGQLVGQVDAAVYSAAQWRERDVVISHFTLPWPEEARRPLTLRIGMYSYPDLEAVLIFDVAGNPYTDALEIEIP